jgi:hypothetical protein
VRASSTVFRMSEVLLQFVGIASAVLALGRLGRHLQWLQVQNKCGSGGRSTRQMKLNLEGETKNSSFEYSCTRIFKTQRPESPKPVSHKHKKSTVSASSLSESTGPDQCQKSTSKWPQTAAHNSIVSASSLSRLNKPDQSQNRPSNSHRRLRSLSYLLCMQPSKKRIFLIKLAGNPTRDFASATELPSITSSSSALGVLVPILRP